MCVCVQLQCKRHTYSLKWFHKKRCLAKQIFDFKKQHNMTILVPSWRCFLQFTPSWMQMVFLWSLTKITRSSVSRCFNLSEHLFGCLSLSGFCRTSPVKQPASSEVRCKEILPSRRCKVCCGTSNGNHSDMTMDSCNAHRLGFSGTLHYLLLPEPLKGEEMWQL